MNRKKKLRVIDYIGHIIIAIDRIDTYSSGLDQAIFLESSLLQDAIIRNLEVIGEAANNIKIVDSAFVA